MSTIIPQPDIPQPSPAPATNPMVDKIRALLRKTTAAGATQAESEAASWIEAMDKLAMLPKKR